MRVIIELPDKENIEPERVLGYIYQKCLEEITLRQDKFGVSIEGTNLKREHRV